MEISSGVDIIDLERFRHTVEKYRHRFLDRVFTEREQSCMPPGKKRLRLLCVSFSFKESVWKALPEDMQKSFYFRDIEILWKGGKPSVSLKGEPHPPELSIHFYTTGKHAVSTAVFTLR